MDKERNLSILSDFYEFTMANGYLENDMQDTIAYFELFFRKVPDDGGFAICCGLDQVVDYINNLHFTEEDLDYFRSKNMFSEKFIDYLKNFKFTGDVWAVPEGSVIFPAEPLLIVRGPVVQVQILETMLLLIINHQSLIATKSNRIVRVSEGRAIMEFGSRRAHGADAATYGARAAYIAGVAGTSNALTDQMFKVPAMGTMAHSWVQMFPDELSAFKAYAKTYPDECVLLVDTYDVLRSGVPNAIKTFDQVLKPLGKRPGGIRIDSGDLAYLSKQARMMLDRAGYSDCKITASSSLDEYTISDLLKQGAKIDSFGVGERLITSKSHPVFGGVYKLVALEKNGIIEPKIKISENVGKITNPGFKQLYRLYDRESGKAEADYITLHEEKVDDSKPLEIFHPTYTWKRKTLPNFKAKKMLVKVFENGKQIYQIPDIEESRNHCKKQVSELWDEVKRFDQPHEYIVDLSQELWETKQSLMTEARYY